MKKISLAIAITSEAFKNTLDKGGHPYIMHCIRVMMNTEGDEDVKCAAIMHDLVKDTDYTFEKLAKLNFSPKTISILMLLTHNKEVEYYDEYIHHISGDKDATSIKKSDLKDNLDITRLKCLRKKDFERLEKYKTAYLYLTNDISS